MDRSRVIVRTSILGILANLLLAGFKAAVGLLSNSIAVVMDAVNNLSDALSSVITIIGTKLAGRKPDKKHPYGHGRTEYITATVIAVIVLYAGVTSLVESVKKILHPETPDYSTVALIIIGVAVAEIVNRVHLPRLPQKDTLFVSSIGDTILDPERHLMPYSKVELNRLLDDGAKFTVATSETQATVRELLAGVELRWPVITMDGAALYDMKTMEYLRTVPMGEEKARRLVNWVQEQGLPFFSNSVEENLLVIRYTELPNPAMQQLFEQKRKSPYRNYVRSPADLERDMLYLLILEKTEIIEEKRRLLEAEPWSADYRIVQASSPFAGYSSLKIYDAAVSRIAMLRQLEQMMQTKKTVTFGSIPGRYDVVILHSDHNRMVRELKRRFEPVSLRGWRNIFHS